MVRALPRCVTPTLIADLALWWSRPRPDHDYRRAKLAITTVETAAGPGSGAPDRRLGGTGWAPGRDCELANAVREIPSGGAEMPDADLQARRVEIPKSGRCESSRFSSARDRLD
jgi:hypothetical protein